MSDRPLLEIEDLHVTFLGDGGRITRAVNGVSFSLEAGQTLGIVGESGSGKSVTALAVLRLLSSESARVSGAIRLDGSLLGDLSERRMQDIRGNRIAMIFQEPMTSLNPSFTVGDQIGEVLVRHRGQTRTDARQEAVRLLERVRIPSARERIDEYPHRLSGGMRQRVMIAMALACAPSVLIADEPTTALDVTIQAQILDLLRELREESGTAIVLITHDLGVVAEMCDEVAVMYAGQVVEQAAVTDIFDQPEHPYTVGLIGSIPRLDNTRDRLTAISGSVPAGGDGTSPCAFAPRCPFAVERCRREPPPLRSVPHGQIGRSHLSRCWRAPLAELAT